MGRVGSGGGGPHPINGMHSRKHVLKHVYSLSSPACLEQVSVPFDLEAVMKSKASDPSALHVVLLQEVERYNSLLLRLRSSCTQVQAGLKGLVVMSADLDEIADALFNAKVCGRLPMLLCNLLLLCG